MKKLDTKKFIARLYIVICAIAVVVLVAWMVWDLFKANPRFTVGVAALLVVVTGLVWASENA